MNEPNIRLTVRRMTPATSIIGVLGELNAFAEAPLMDAHVEASGPETKSIILDFSGMEYMNSGGIGLLVTLLVRMQRQGQRLLAFGLSEHYQRIFEMTRLQEVIAVFPGEEAALKAAGEA